MTSDWREIPQPRFLSWTPAEQHAYCMARDLDATARSDTPEEAEFHRRRAHMYQEMIDAQTACILSR